MVVSSIKPKNFSNNSLNRDDLPEDVQNYLRQLKTENKQLKSQLEELTQGGIKILFSGKANAQRIARKVKPRTLREIKSLSIGTEEQKSQNLVIEGDNLLAMATLYQYHGKIDLIIADPPYNTGKDFRYNDRWDQDPNDPGLGNYVKADDPSRHTKWMKFMLPRLQLMKEMLKPGGVLAFCIDENEFLRLGMMLDEVFGEVNRIAIINWQKNYAPKSNAGHISAATEYVFVYAKNKERAKTARIPVGEKDQKRFKNPDKDPQGPWVVSDPGSQSIKPNDPKNKAIYAIQNPFTGKLEYPRTGRQWRCKKSSMKEWLEGWGSQYEERDLQDGWNPALVIKGSSNFNSRDPAVKKASQKAYQIYQSEVRPPLVFASQGKGKPAVKLYLSQIQQGKIPITYWANEEYGEISKLGNVSWPYSESGHTTAAYKELASCVGATHSFVTGKPLKLFQKIIQLWCPPNGKVLDPFAGSGTTGHAALQLNKETGTNRRFILIELGNLETDDSYCRTLLQKRLQAVITGKWTDQKEHEPLNVGFTFYSLNKTIDAQTLLEMKKDDLTDAILASQMESQWTLLENHSYLIAKNPENEGIFLVWNGNSKSQLTQEIYYQVVAEAKKVNLSTEKYIIYARLCSFRSENLEFKQIPSEILASFRIYE